MKSRTIKVDYLARVEGEGGLHIKIKDNKILDAKLNIFEPPRFFEAFLRDRKFTEAPDITARICGICPIAYQMSSVHAMEDACGVKIDGPLRELRRLIYCGEWIESHVLHIYMLHAPDFLGYQDAIRMAKDHPDVNWFGLYLTPKVVKPQRPVSTIGVLTRELEEAHAELAEALEGNRALEIVARTARDASSERDVAVAELEDVKRTLHSFKALFFG